MMLRLESVRIGFLARPLFIGEALLEGRRYLGVAVDYIWCIFSINKVKSIVVAINFINTTIKFNLS